MNQRAAAVLDSYPPSAGTRFPTEAPDSVRTRPLPAPSWRILLAESNPWNAETSARGLRRHGHEVKSATTGSTALREHAGAGLVLLDLALPDLYGLGIPALSRRSSSQSGVGHAA